MLDISPHMLSVIPFGIICGAIGVELGFDPYLVYAMSFIIFGGASQIVFLQVLSGGASSLVAVTSVGSSIQDTYYMVQFYLSTLKNCH
jgi:predicted branched-subunit amino acid permease